MFKRKSILREWGISYALILLVPIITIFINYNFNILALEDETVQAYELMLDNLTDNIDGIVESQQKMYNQIYLDTVFADFMSFADTSNSYGYELYQLKTQLSLYEIDGDTVSFWVYLKDTEYIIQNSEAYREHFIYQARADLDKNFPKYEDWKRALTAEYQNDFIFCDALGSETCLMYASSYNYRGNKGANILITTMASTFEDMTSTLPRGAVLGIYIHDDDYAWKNRILYISCDGVIGFPEDASFDTSEEAEALLGFSDHVQISQLTGNGKISCRLFVPQESIQDGARYIRKVHLISLGITCFVGIALVIFLLKRNSKPVYSLLEIVGDGGEEVNEFERLKSAYGYMKRENLSMKESMQIQKKTLISSYLLSLLKGRGIKNSTLEQELGIDTSLCDSSFVLMGFYIPVDEREQDPEYNDLSFFVVDNIMSELMEKEEFYLIEDGCFLFYLFRVPQASAEKWEENNLDKINYLCDLLDEKLNLSITAIISSVEQDISRAKHMYQSVMTAFEYRKVLGGSGVIRVEETTDSDENKKYQGYNRKLVHALERGELDEAYLIARQLFAGSRNLSFIALRLRALEAYQAISDYYNTYIDDSVKRMQLMSRLEFLLNAENDEELKKQFEALLAFVHAKLNGQWEVEDKGLVEIVREYVEKNYMDCNLNIGSIAEGLGKNPRYISTVFKKETGEGILDYVNILRIRKAQEILLTSRISLEELSTIVGYSNVRTFRRAFTKVVGMVPSSYLEKK